MRIFITGATGLIGRRLVLDRLRHGDQVVLLSRDGTKATRRFAADANPNISVVEGNPKDPGPWQQHVHGCDAVVNLAGAGIADRRWNSDYKRELRDSRIQSTKYVVEAMRSAAQPPKVLLNASAVGFYGETRDTPTGENAAAGDDFLARLCTDWEAEANLAAESRIRVVKMRFGAVLDERGGMLAKLLPQFKWGMGGTLGAGRQYMSWIHWRDVDGLIDLCLHEPSLHGPVNFTAPVPVTNREFGQTLAYMVNRPCWLPMPRFLLKLVMGEFADYVYMSQRIVPTKANNAGYMFAYPQIESALEALIHRQPATPGPVVAIPELSENRVLAPANSGNNQQLAGQKGVLPPRALRLAAIDVEGTLLRSDGSLHPEVAESCRLAMKAGCVVVLATARPPRAIQSVLHQLQINAPTINYNGAVIWSPVSNRAQFHEPLSPNLAREIIREARLANLEIVVAVEILDERYTDRQDIEFNMHDSEIIEPLDSRLQESVTRIDLVGPPEVLGEVEPVIREQYWQKRLVSLFRTEPNTLSIMHPMVDKGIALQRVAKRLNITRDEVMAIGGGVNDIGMLEWAGFSVAVANAPEQVQRMATVVVPTNNALGVAHAIHRFVPAHRVKTPV